MVDEQAESVVDEIGQRSSAIPTRLRRLLPDWTKRLIARAYWMHYDATDWFAEWVGHCIFHGLRRTAYRRLLGVQIGDRSSIHRHCRFYRPKGVVIGDHSVINREVLMDGRYGLHIGSNVSVSEGVMLLTAEHDPQDCSFALRGAPIVLKNCTFVGARAIVLPGITVGEGSVVGAGAVVTRDVAPHTIVAGVPARAIGRRTQDIDYQLDYTKFLG